MRVPTACLVAGGAVLTAAAIGSRRGPQGPRAAIWYGSLRKPSYTPPGSAIGAAWGGLDVLLGVTGVRLLCAPPSRARSTALAAWVLNLTGLASFSWVFFGRKRLDEALGVTAAMLTATAAQVAASSRVDRVATIASLPLAVWLSFAGLLGEELWRRNPGQARP